MKIAFCVLKNPSFGGGIEKYTFELGSRLVQRGHEVTVYSMRHYGRLPREIRGMRIVGIPCVPVRCLEKLSASAMAAFHVMLNGKFDIVHLHHVGPGSFAWIPKLRGAKCVFQSHGLAWRSNPWGAGGSMFLHALERVAVRQCDARTGVSMAQCRYYRDRYGLDMTYMPAGAKVREKVEPREIRRLGLSPNRYVLYVGRLSPEKGVHHLVSAFGRLATSCRLVLAGSACGGRYEKELHALAGGDERIRFLGFVQGRPLAELFSSARIYVQPSELEGLSLALLEAMGYGVPCLVSDIPENLEAIGEDGWHFRNKDAAGLAERLNWMLAHPRRTLAAGERTRSRVREHYSWDRIADQCERLYEGALRSRAA